MMWKVSRKFSYNMKKLDFSRELMKKYGQLHSNVLLLAQMSCIYWEKSRILCEEVELNHWNMTKSSSKIKGLQTTVQIFTGCSFSYCHPNRVNKDSNFGGSQYIQEQSLYKMSNMDCQLLRQKVHQKISVMKTNSGVFVVFKTKRELKCHNELKHCSVCFHY